MKTNLGCWWNAGRPRNRTRWPPARRQLSTSIRSRPTLFYTLHTRTTGWGVVSVKSWNFLVINISIGIYLIFYCEYSVVSISCYKASRHFLWSPRDFDRSNKWGLGSDGQGGVKKENVGITFKDQKTRLVGQQTLLRGKACSVGWTWLSSPWVWFTNSSLTLLLWHYHCYISAAAVCLFSRYYNFLLFHLLFEEIIMITSA